MKPSILMAAVIAFAFVVAIFAQPSGAASACPTFTIKVQAGDDAIYFSVSPTPEGVTYNWSTAAGTIVSGQGTSSVMVATTGIPKGEEVQAMLQIGGLDAACAKQASLSATAKVH